MDAMLKLSCNELSEDDVQELTYEMIRAINDETDIAASAPEGKGEKGMRGDMGLVGQIVLTALTSGTVVALINVLKSYVERERTLKVEISGKDDTKLILDAQHMTGDQTDALIAMAREFAEKQK